MNRNCLNDGGKRLSELQTTLSVDDAAVLTFNRRPRKLIRSSEEMLIYQQDIP